MKRKMGAPAIEIRVMTRSAEDIRAAWLMFQFESPQRVNSVVFNLDNMLVRLKLEHWKVLSGKKALKACNVAEENVLVWKDIFSQHRSPFWIVNTTLQFYKLVFPNSLML
jgi:hypothetical protein